MDPTTAAIQLVPVTLPRAAEDQTTGLPGLRTWRAVYGLVLVLFAVYVVLLIVLERIFS